MKKLFKAIEIFYSYAWSQPDNHLPKEYRQSRISLMTAYEVSASWYRGHK